ncbi:tetratricopeptide repeat protein [Actinoallomurus sp. NPDC050550]|uniref:ATP-binding protein n=1 Tax=Actinoallomurus sp. NPDC050550 TaxID=3154937 RepID=UPI0033E6CB0F
MTDDHRFQINPGRDAYTAGRDLNLNVRLSDEGESRPPPDQLPLDVPAFTGRERELSRLAELAATGGSVVVTAIDGTAGVGKTALAVHAAHRCHADFPDGRLYVDLGGHSEGAGPADPADVLDGFLRDLGFASEKISSRSADRTKLFRSALAKRRMIVLLDNAASEEQVRPLLPGSGSSLVIITSRNSLAGLEIGADTRITLDVLDEDQAVEMLAVIAGRDRTAKEPAAASEIVRLCDLLPLALSIAGRVLATHPAWPLERLAERLRDERHRLDELEVGDRAVRAAFAISYAKGAEAPTRMFRLLGLHPGPDVTASAAAALTDVDERSAARTLDALARAHLLREETPGRFRMHDLLRLFAREQAEQDESAESRDAATRRLFAYYRDVAFSIYDRWEAARTGSEDTAAAAAEALSVFDEERMNLVRVALLAATDDPATLWDIAQAIEMPLSVTRRFTDILELFKQVADSADKAGNPRLVLTAVRAIAAAYHDTWSPNLAVEGFERALAVARTARDETAEQGIQNDLGLAYRLRGDLDAAIECFQEAERIATRTRDQAALARAYGNLAQTHRMLGRLGEALRFERKALRLFRRLRERRDEALALSSLAQIHMGFGEYKAGRECCEKALIIFRRLGDRHNEALAHHTMANLYLVQDREAEARQSFRKAIEILDDTDPFLAQQVRVVATQLDP